MALANQESRTGKLTILVVDDSLTFRSTLGDRLRRIGNEVLLAESGQQAIGALRQQPDAILIDIEMPGMDGIETCQRIRGARGAPMGARLPILMLTARDDLTTRMRGRAAGADEFLWKAPDFEAVVASVIDFVRRTTAGPGSGPRSNGTVLAKVVAASGLATVIAETAILRACRRAGVDSKAVTATDLQRVRPAQLAYIDALYKLIDYETLLVRQQDAKAVETYKRGLTLLLTFGGGILGLALLVSLTLSRGLRRDLTSAIQHMQASSVELQGAATQQATGAKEQASATSEVSTTLKELVATARQIGESAQRVAQLAEEARGVAKGGDLTGSRAQEAVSATKRQVDLIVHHMLDLGKKSQQIGGVLDIINELSEQTNILSINATIEASGAGEAGTRFSAVAEEIRKLADRTAGSTKEIRTLVEEIRSGVNTTVMVTEGGSKAADAAAKQITEVVAAFGKIAQSVVVTTQAAQEIELSTKQQGTAVEQVNLAIASVAQAAKDSEVSTAQTLQTSSQLASLSRDLIKLVRSESAR